MYSLSSPSVLVRWMTGLVLVSFCLSGAAGCRGAKSASPRRGKSDDKAYPARAVSLHQEARLPPLQGTIPTIPDAQFVNDDQLCGVCHESYEKYHRTSIHRGQSCESCHGPGSQHIRTRGREPGTILSFKKMTPLERSETCLQCHQNDACCASDKWRTSVHAHRGVACTDCHTGHYNVPPGTPATDLVERAFPSPVQPAAFHQPPPDDAEMQAIRRESRAMGAADSHTCNKCHQGKQELHMSGRFHAAHAAAGFNCRTCHDPHGNVTAATRTDLCLSCHQGSPHVAQWSSSAHGRAGVACADCHDPHPDGPSPPSNADPFYAALGPIRRLSMSAEEPNMCYKCHPGMADQQHLAHPHQICGAAGMSCTTCHDPHGKIRPETRTDLCLNCHTGHPTMGWHSSTHAQFGVACADCHNPHPKIAVSEFVSINHTHIRRPPRLPMQVDEPFACYGCHPKTAAEFSLPSHHPVLEGKMTCSDCHDAHGQYHGGLKEPTLNMMCYKCHAEKQGPFAYEHPPVTENCAICHNPHGTVANNLLHQPTTFLCLRCHTGHRTSPRGPNHAGLLGDVGTSPALQAAFFTDCTQCHSQVHGSDVPTPRRPHAFMR